MLCGTAWSCCSDNKTEFSERREEIDDSQSPEGSSLVLQVLDNDKGREFLAHVLSILAETHLSWRPGMMEVDGGFPALEKEHGVFAEVLPSPQQVKEQSKCAHCCPCTRTTEPKVISGQSLFLFVGLSVKTLVKFAARQDLRMLLHSKTLRAKDIDTNRRWRDGTNPELALKFMTESRDADGKLVRSKLPDDKLAIPAAQAYEFITAPAKYFHPAGRDKNDELFYVYKHTKSVFSSSDAVKVMVRAIQEAGIDLSHEVEVDMSESPLKQWFPEDHSNLRKSVKDCWLSWKTLPWDQPLSKLRYYFGEKVTMYFAFLGHTSFWMLFPAIFGLAVFIRRYATEGEDATENGWRSVYALGTVVWITLYLELWKRVQATKAQEWGMEAFEKEQVTRPQFLTQAKGGRSSVTGEVQPYESRLWQLLRRMVSFSSISTLVVIVLIAVFSMFVLRVWLVKKEPDDIKEGWGDRSTALINAFQIQIMGFVYKLVAKKLTDFENHRTQTSWEDSLITKTCLFQFVNNYFSLFYIAFLKKNIEILGSKQECDDNDCLGELETQLTTLLLVRIITGNLTELLYPKVMAFLKYLIRKTCGSWFTGRTFEVEDPENHSRLQKVQRKASVQPYDPLDDYLELLIMFGYAGLFGVAFPLAPLIVLINTVLEVRVDASKLFLNYQRPIPSGAQDIGSWYVFFNGIGLVGVLTNLGVAIFTNTDAFFGYDTEKEKLWCFLVLQYGVFAIKYLLAFFVRDVPTHVAERIGRSHYLSKKLVKPHHHRHGSLAHVGGRGGFIARRFTPGHSALAAMLPGAGAAAAPTATADVEVEMAPLAPAGEQKGTDTGVLDVTNPMHEAKLGE